MKKSILWLAVFSLAACTQEELTILDSDNSSISTKAYNDGLCSITSPRLTIEQSPIDRLITVNWIKCPGNGGGINGETHTHTYDIKVTGKIKFEQSNALPPFSLPYYYTLSRGDGIRVEVTDKIFYQYGRTGGNNMSSLFIVNSANDGIEYKVPCLKKLYVKGNYYYDRGRNAMIVKVYDDSRSHGNKLQASIWTRKGNTRKCIKSDEMKEGYAMFELGVVSLAIYDSLNYTIRLQALDQTCTMNYSDIPVYHYASADFEGVEGYSGTLQFTEVSKVGNRSDW